MSTIHVSKGARVFIPSIDMFGEITRTSALGGTAAAVLCDDGVLRLFCGELMRTDVVDKDTQKDGNGAVQPVSTDVRTVGPPILDSFGVDDETKAVLFQKFMVLEENVRKEKASFWEANKDNQTVMSTFIPELLELLGDDTAFIQAKSERLLRDVDESVKSKMLTNMMTKPEEDRKALIMHYTSIQNDAIKVDEFLQNMFELLLEDGDYLVMELKKALRKLLIDEAECVRLTSNFIANTTAEEQAEVASTWRTAKFYRSKKGTKFAHDLVTKYSEQTSEAQPEAQEQS